ncbi:precorrin-2 C(20)-methyltransferase [Alkalinema pantanalense CENA528]|uniref:precorrin-2 C(20)-methyltransferase n=1 Tax=Alkalinema pantanalense TaxID=1620705 RepID=UPI003D6F04E3
MGLGTLYGVGVGPSDPELITLKGLRRIVKTPIVAFPAGLNGKLGVAEAIVQPWLHAHQVRLPLHFPYVRQQDTLETAWKSAAQRILPYLEAGQDVVFISEGDVSFYSTFTYLAQAVKTAQPFARIETIPGICSPLAAAAELGLPLTLQGQRLAVLPAIYSVAELETALQWADVVVLMKVSSVYAEVWDVLKHHNLLEQSYVVERATAATQRVYDHLQDWPDLKLPYFSLMIVKVRDNPGFLEALP